ncbi:MAG: crossover junction endodeoxyribonuclease RuvC [Actinomycetaceae bacterium]|nr:crossover junction endodeoxyribonuclease RuvC [Actinomycetaceae bacterium]
MRVMGIDPGLTRCGIGIIDVDDRRVASLIHVSVVRSASELATHFRLSQIADGIDEAIETFHPEIVAIERVFAQDNLQSVTTTMQVMGIAMLSAARHGLPLGVHTPSEVKAAVSGSGSASKAQVEHMVARILRLKEAPKPADAADALAIAITQAWRGTGIAGAGEDGVVTVSLSGGVRTKQGLTPAQQVWAEAEAQARRTGAVDPRRRKRGTQTG